MKKLTAPFALLLSLLFVSCQKEISFENTGQAGGTARYSFEGGTGPCTGTVLTGSLVTGTPATSANTATFSVTVDSIGTYIISTTPVNGITFTGSGVFTNTGLQQITLTASGTPLSSGTYNFTPTNNGCSFSVMVAPNNGNAGGSASYNFDGGTSTCTGALVNGTFTEGIATTAGNAVTLNVDVKTVGTYNISTNAVNGVTFAGTGSFSTTGPQSITLVASGTPGSEGTYSFTPGGGACTFVVTVVGAGNGGGNGGGGGTNFLKCKINGTLVNFNKGLVGYYVPPPMAAMPFSVNVQGKNSDVAGSTEELWVSITNPTDPTTGVYTNRTFATDVVARRSQMAVYPKGFFTTDPYWGSSVFNANSFTVNITSVSTSGAAGTFSGTIYETNGLGPATKNVTEGEFKISF